MAEETSEANLPQPPPFMEVLCRSSGKKHRFAAGTKAGFAVSLMNRKLGSEAPYALYVEAVKNGEEPISFGPDAVLVAFGDDWQLQTVTEVDFSGTCKREGSKPTQLPIPNVKSFAGSNRVKGTRQGVINSLYIAKILLAFILMFVLGGILTLSLENLPRLILFVNSLL